MKIAFTGVAATAALAMVLTGVPASAQYNNDQQRNSPNQVQHPDYSKNKFYSVGNREGYEDHQKKAQRPAHEHAYRNDEDRKAHDYGYQQGWNGQKGYPSTTDRH
jgi:hypothetical protein